ncbi:EAL domain-containing protein [Stenotrophomonas sp. C3(2023)]|uniref:putative bifunctional diguanylate cyclase/phosphodiesterase n=1 Tax=Stenotrophomonas sp. C3(2023) TaxID=3080277 RepID=UPI00293C42E0|nr:EAL domain-containing protein [Stenotrophomonas sp. C3(2023)]MDV3468798.1 EAL domain-containing protein [Stenotrophomonas sp. C3(2023)]
MLAGSYDPWLVTLSLLVALLASFTALAMASRATTAHAHASVWAWRFGGGAAMGLGIWSMHFIGMLAFSLPIPVGYGLTLTLVSLACVVGSSVFALWLVSLPDLPALRLFGGAALLGAGIATMHYVGMAAMQMEPGIEWHPGWVALSLFVAVAASWSALYIAFHLRTRPGLRKRITSATLLAVGICGMHYTGMAAARFPSNSICGAAGDAGLPATSLALLVVVFTVLILGMALGLSWMEQRLESQLLRMRNATLSDSLSDAQHELTQAALHDPLTRLPNRRLLQQRIERALVTAEQESGRFAVMFLDLDGFKQVNDVYGHQAGDALLVAVSERIGRLLRPSDMLARLGGDEFVLVVDMAPGQDIGLYAQRLLQALDSADLVPARDMQITASVGIALCPDHAASERQLMAFADAAMYQAKDAGRNRYMMYSDAMQDSAEQQFRLLADLRRAVSNGELLLHYQPKVLASTQHVCGAEALIRWQHPERGLVPPDSFIRLAERSGVICDIGRWALREACRQLRQWHEQGHTDWTIAVNLSPLQFTSSTLLQDVQQALVQHDLPPRSLVLEITEGTVMRDTETSVGLLHALAALGVGISIDDFGTGYSSLLYLKRLPATELKIDHAFVRDLEHSQEDVVIVSAVVALGHALDMDIVAEGVETAAQRAYLERLGCNYLQGYLLGRPVGAERFAQLYAERRPRVVLTRS